MCGFGKDRICFRQDCCGFCAYYIANFRKRQFYFMDEQSKKLPIRAVEYYGMKSAFTTYMGARTARSAPISTIVRGSLSIASAPARSKISFA